MALSRTIFLLLAAERRSCDSRAAAAVTSQVMASASKTIAEVRLMEGVANLLNPILKRAVSELYLAGFVWLLSFSLRHTTSAYFYISPLVSLLFPSGAYSLRTEREQGRMDGEAGGQDGRVRQGGCEWRFDERERGRKQAPLSYLPHRTQYESRTDSDRHSKTHTHPS